MKLSYLELMARVEAYDEAADHLGMKWTDDVNERVQGDIVAKRLRKSADQYWKMAKKIESSGDNH